MLVACSDLLQPAGDSQQRRTRRPGVVAASRSAQVFPPRRGRPPPLQSSSVKVARTLRVPSATERSGGEAEAASCRPACGNRRRTLPKLGSDGGRIEVKLFRRSKLRSLDQLRKRPHEWRPGNHRFERLVVEERQCSCRGLLGIGRGTGAKNTKWAPAVAERFDSSILHARLRTCIAEQPRLRSPRIPAKSRAGGGQAFPKGPADSSSKKLASPAARHRPRCPRRLPGSARVESSADHELRGSGFCAIRCGTGASHGLLRQVVPASLPGRSTASPGKLAASIRSFSLHSVTSTSAPV